MGNQLHYVHVACTEFLTAMHTGDRTKEAIDAGGILPGYAGTIVRDGYKGYEHLTDALHAWCGAHGLRDLAGLYRFDRHGQVWARSMADLLIDVNAAATAATWPGPGQTGRPRGPGGACPAAASRDAGPVGWLRREPTDTQRSAIPGVDNCSWNTKISACGGVLEVARHLGQCADPRVLVGGPPHPPERYRGKVADRHEHDPVIVEPLQ